MFLHLLSFANLLGTFEQHLGRSYLARHCKGPLTLAQSDVPHAFNFSPETSGRGRLLANSGTAKV
eukprot:766388-Hanusia_phi.AAC.2